MQRTIDWDDTAGEAVVVIDQCALPHTFRTLRLTTVDEVIEAVRRLAVRGAPALGAAGALGVVLSARAHRVRRAEHSDDPLVPTVPEKSTVPAAVPIMRWESIARWPSCPAGPTRHSTRLSTPSTKTSG